MKNLIIQGLILISFSSFAITNYIMNKEQIPELRSTIDSIDKKIIELIAERMIISEKIGKEKIKAHLPIKDESRETSILQSHESIADKYNLPKQLIDDLFNIIILYSRKIQNEQ